MSETVLRRIAYVSFAIIFFVCTLVLVRWTIDFVTWISLDSGWAQAIGSMAALGVAIFIMQRQAESSARIVLDADRRALIRRANAVFALIQRAAQQATTSRHAILRESKQNLGELQSTVAAAEIVLREIHASLKIVPLHELGSYDLVTGAQQMIDAISRFRQALDVILASGNSVSSAEIEMMLDIIKTSIHNAHAKYEDALLGLK